ncbi:flavodoxin [Sphingobium yanoikuyae]|jgi:flavodoxin|uniref:flavodoxin n=1 Tax=Sphingobium yanoikuyae TaxID=13690 RepID=UPI0028AA0E30|nr:flavodoxin [Sphingobium yanoikuyae]
MHEDKDLQGFDAALSRRDLMVAGFAGATLTAATACAQTAGGANGDARPLVVYFTRSGNTRVIARGLARMLAAPLAELVPVTAYPDDYEANVAQAERERRAGTLPPLRALSLKPADHDLIFLGFPIWGMTVPAVIRTFLGAHDLSGKRIAPFITHGGYGIGDSLSVLDSHAPQAQRLTPFTLECDQERRTLAAVDQWLGGLGLAG